MGVRHTEDKNIFIRYLHLYHIQPLNQVSVVLTGNTNLY